MGIGLDSNFETVRRPNGIWFSPVFLTCVNTTTNNPPGIFLVYTLYFFVSF